MPNTDVVALTGHTAQTGGSSSMGSGCLIAFGLPFLVAGAFIGAVGLGYFPVGPSDAPRAIIGSMGVVFFGSGLLVSGQGVAGLFRRRRADRLMRERPHEHWNADHRWNREGERERPFASAVHGLLGIGFFALFLLPFNWWAMQEPGIVTAIVGLFDLLLVGMVGYWLYMIGRALKYGAAWIRYDRFPFFLGDRLDVRLGCRGRLNGFEKVTVVLRFIRVKFERSGKSNQPVCYQHWAETLEFEGRALTHATDLPVSFQLPAGDYGTWLSESPPAYWEIEMKGEAPGIDFGARFLVPVYAR